MLRGDHNQCPTCQELFNSTGVFDRHRTGTYTPNTRRCLTVSEMTAKGMLKNNNGYWIRMALEAGTVSLQDAPKGDLRG